MMTTREKILKKLRESKTAFSGAQPVRDHLAVSPLDSIQLMDLKGCFIRAAENLSCTVYDVQQPKDVAQILASVLKREKQVSAWDWDQIPYDGLKQSLNDLSIQVSDPADPSVRVGITGAAAALAASGSIAVNRNPGRPNGPSLLPPVHIAIITEDQILPNFESWISKQRLDGLSDFQQSGNIVMISGPSRTADIAMELILGMHGPKELHIIILPGG